MFIVLLDKYLDIVIVRNAVPGHRTRGEKQRPGEEEGYVMARIRVTFDGATAVNGSSLLMHNERLADPIDPYSRWLGELTKKRSKTERDIEEIGRREFFGAGYWQTDEGPEGKRANPYVPTWNIVRCLQEAATRHKLGKQVLRGIIPVEEESRMIYDGPEDADELWKSGLFHSRKGVGVGQKRVMRTRPCFTDWKIEAELELDLTILDPDVVNLLAIEAGRYIGLCDARPRFGRFLGMAELLADGQEFGAPDVLDDLRQKLAMETAGAAIQNADKAHATVSANGKTRSKRVRDKAAK